MVFMAASNIMILWLTSTWNDWVRVPRFGVGGDIKTMMITSSTSSFYQNGKAMRSDENLRSINLSPDERELLIVGSSSFWDLWLSWSHRSQAEDSPSSPAHYSFYWYGSCTSGGCGNKGSHNRSTQCNNLPTKCMCVWIYIIMYFLWGPFPLSIPLTSKYMETIKMN